MDILDRLFRRKPKEGRGPRWAWASGRGPDDAVLTDAARYAAAARVAARGSAAHDQPEREVVGTMPDWRDANEHLSLPDKGQPLHRDQLDAAIGEGAPGSKVLKPSKKRPAKRVEPES